MVVVVEGGVGGTEHPPKKSALYHCVSNTPVVVACWPLLQSSSSSCRCSCGTDKHASCSCYCAGLSITSLHRGAPLVWDDDVAGIGASVSPFNENIYVFCLSHPTS